MAPHAIAGLIALFLGLAFFIGVLAARVSERKADPRTTDTPPPRPVPVVHSANKPEFRMRDAGQNPSE